MAAIAVKKPSRSDEVASADEQIRIAQEIQRHFDSVAPKRARKPGRSEPGSLEDDSAYAIGDIPEVQRFKELEACSEPLKLNGGVVNSDDHCATDYYRSVTAVKEGPHYTTGSGFIKIESSVEDSLNFSNKSARASDIRFKCNPATNEWEPALEQVLLDTRKPARSDP